MAEVEDGELKGMEICNLGGSETPLPIDFINSAEIFSEVVSLNTWGKVLAVEDRRYLEKFLPTLPTDYPHAQEDNLRELFGGNNFRFGNPVQDFHSKLKDGYFYPDIVKYKKLCQKAKYKEYKIQQQQYYRKLLQEVMVSRQEILDQVSRQGPSDPIRTRGKVGSDNGSVVEQRVQIRLRKILHECRQESEDGTISSDDEERLLSNGSGPFRAMGYQVPGFHVAPGIFVPPGYHPMVPPIPGMPYGFPSFPYSTPAPCLPSTPLHTFVTESDFQKMLQKHKKKRIENEEHPELDTRFTSLQDIVYRTNPSKRPSKTSELNKKKDKKARLKRKLKQKLQQKQERQSHAKKQEAKEAAPVEPPSTTNLPPAPTGKFSCFFSLLREVFYALPDLKGTLQKIEEQVRSWQASPSLASSTWGSQQSDWVKLVYSLLIYLSGSSGVTPSTFIPLVDFKERPQQWKWIGAFRDSDEELTLLCQDWLQVKDQLSIKKTTSEGGSSVNAPEARVKTDYVVRPSTSDERDDFRAQEAKRYINPHKAYTFMMHRFESIVGPVKGVFSKETNLNKAREHSLLISNRPPFVTILTLVRDAAARLPNGEGTRAEVCELLKDSQFLNPDATDTQIHTVVSGALDRLHYEKDPCVKYDSNRKVWIYLHRNRTEEEFEKIHQANAAAARAKKLQKPRMPRQPKLKEETTPQHSAPVSEAVDPSAVIAVASPDTQPAPNTSKTAEVKKPAIKLKIAGTFSPVSSGHPKVSVITSVPQETKSAEQKTGEQEDPPVTHGPRIMATIQGGTVIISTQPKTGAKSKLNTAGTSKKPHESSYSPKLKYVSALNTHASPLNTAGYSPLPVQEVVEDSGHVVEESHDRVPSGSECESSSSSGSENESGSASGSSSEGEEGWIDEHTGGKTTPGDQETQEYSEPPSHDAIDQGNSRTADYDYSTSQHVQQRKSVISEPFGYTSLSETGAKEDVSHESDEEHEGYASSEGMDSESEYSNED